MKVEKAETKFTPVVITLESQAEVDAMLICLNTTWDRFKNQAKSLEPYISENAASNALPHYSKMFNKFLELKLL